jgi:hypothetical protein
MDCGYDKDGHDARKEVNMTNPPAPKGDGVELPPQEMKFTITEDDIRMVANSSDQTRYLMAQMCLDATRQILALRREIQSLKSSRDTWKQLAHEWEEAALKSRESQEGKWIAVGDRTPEIPVERQHTRFSDPVLCTDGEEIWIWGCYQREGEDAVWCYPTRTVTHWQPLPAPPTVVKKAEAECCLAFPESGNAIQLLLE